MGTGTGPNFGNTGGSRSSATIRAYSKERVKTWAEKKRSELTGKSKKNFNTACVVYDSETGKYYYGRNGGYHEKDYIRNPILFGDDTHAGLLPKTSLNRYPVGNCAEVDAVNRALNDGAKLKNLHMTTIHVTKKQFGEYKPSCENCTHTFRGRIQENFSGWVDGGK